MRRVRSVAWWLGAACLLALPRQAQAPTRATSEESAPLLPQRNGESWALLQGLARVTHVQLHVPSGACERAAARLTREFTEQGVFAVSAPTTRDPAALRILVGTPADPALEAVVKALGLELLAPGFRLLGRDYLRPGDALVAVLQDPLRAGRPLCAVLGNDPDLVAAYLDEIPRLTRPHLLVYADGELALECPLTLAGAPRAEAQRDYLASRERYFSSATPHELGSRVVHTRGEGDAELWNAYGAALERVEKRVLAWLGVEEAPRAELFFYDHLEDFEACLGTSALSVANRLHPRVHVLLAAGMPDDGGSGLARILARAIAGAPEGEWMEDGLAVAASARWWTRPLTEWSQQLSAAGLLPEVEELVSWSGAERHDEHVLLPARALLFQEVVRASGANPSRLRALWKDPAPELAPLAERYTRTVRATAVPPPAESREGDSPEPRPSRVTGAPFRHGLALVEGSAAVLGARSFAAALEEILALDPGPDSVALTVFGTTLDPAAPCLAARPRAAHATLSDLALANAVAAARTRGLGVLLSLEVLAHPNGAWADVISWTGVEDNQRFFEGYGRVALHMACLAELLGVELFSFGSNLRESTRTETSEERRDPERLALRRAGWNALIARLARIYGGGLLYTARFPSEANDIAFFDQVDAIGLAFYPGLARGAAAQEDGELRRVLRYELQQALDLAVRWNRPLYLQLGFPARGDSWMQPFVPRGRPDPEAQRRYFTACADVFGGKLENREVLSGVFLWNWPLDARASDDAGFSLRGQPAEAAVWRLLAR